MARITVEDCLNHESNRFALVKLASLRAKQLLEGKSAVTDTKGNRAIVSALREIAAGKIKFSAEEEETLLTHTAAALPASETPVESESSSVSNSAKEQEDARDSAIG